MTDKEKLYKKAVENLQKARNDLGKLIGYPNRDPHLKDLYYCYANLNKLLAEVVKNRPAQKD